jgi:signal transduction histidine kinase
MTVAPAPVSPRRDWNRAITSPYLWIVVALLVVTTLLHYLTPQTRLLPAPANAFLDRHAVERFFFVLPVVVATYAFRWRGGVFTLAFAILIMLPRAIWISPSAADALFETAAATAVGALAIWAIEAQAGQRELHQKLAVENARLYARMRFYARQVIQAEEEERERIARELHDETIQLLIAIARRLDLLATQPQGLTPATQQLLGSVQELLRDTQRGMRRFVRGLRPPTLDHLGLVAATRGLVKDLARETGLEADLQVTGEARRLTPEQELALFRIVQEALRNVRRHAEASRVLVQLAFRPDRVQITIDDDGRGFDVPERTDDLLTIGKLGLIGIDERARGLGGTLTLQSELGRGTVVTVEVPLQSGSEKAGAHAQQNR